MLLVLALFGLALGNKLDKTPEKELPPPKPEEIVDAEHRIADVWLVIPKEPEAPLKSSYLRGLPWMKFKPCESDEDCGKDYLCKQVEEAEQKFCQLKEDLAKLAMCPLGKIPIANKWCKSDEDCKIGTCNMIPASDPREWDSKDDETFRDDVGMCCCDPLEQNAYPEAVDRCPTGMKLLRSSPCGIAARECPGASKCYAEVDGDKFGRCCLTEENADIKTKSSFHGHFRGYRHRYRHGHGHGHGGYHGGYGGHRGHYHGGYRRYRYGYY